MNHVLSVVHGIEMLAVGFRIVIQKLIAYETEDERRSLTPKILVGQHIRWILSVTVKIVNRGVF
jgi:hypothetical protein